MIRETWIIDNEAKLMEVFGHELSIGLLFFHAESQSFDATKEEEGIKRSETIPDGVDDVGELFGNVVSIAYYGPGHKIMMTTEIFGSTIVDDVGIVLEWPLQVGTHHGIVDNNECVRSAFL